MRPNSTVSFGYTKQRTAAIIARPVESGQDREGEASPRDDIDDSRPVAGGSAQLGASRRQRQTCLVFSSLAVVVVVLDEQTLV